MSYLFVIEPNFSPQIKKVNFSFTHTHTHMWSVLRRQQGEYYEREPNVPPPPPVGEAGSTTVVTDKVDLTLRSLHRHQIRPYTLPSDPMVLTAPFGNVVYPKLVSHLSHENVVLRRQAVQGLFDLLTLKAEHVVVALQHGVLEALVERLSDADDDIRTQSCIVLDIIVKVPCGQEAMLAAGSDVLRKILRTADDTCSEVVVEVLKLLQSCSSPVNQYELTRKLVQLGSIGVLVKKISSNDDAVCGAACGAVRTVFGVKDAFVPFLEQNGVEVVTKALLRASDPLIVAETATVISDIAFYGAGKLACVQHRSITALTPHLSHESVTVRAAVATSMAQLLVHEKGKAQALENGVVPALTAALNTEDEADVLAGLAKSISLLGEHPEARKQFVAVLVPRLTELVEIAAEHPTLQAAAQHALQRIEWQPGSPLP